MAPATHTHGRFAAFVALILCSCVPLHDLDKASSGRGGAPGDGARGPSSEPSEGGIGGSCNWDAGPAAGGAGGAAATASSVDAASTADAPTSAGTAGAGGAPPGTGGSAFLTAGSSGGGGAPGNGGSSGTTSTGSTDLPDIDGSPVQGNITYSEGASWAINDRQWPAFEIHTPTASYWLVKSDAAIVSITDTSQLQWINFDSSFRPNRGTPNLGGCCQPGNPAALGLPMMSTELDPSFTVTSTHLRLISKSDDGAYQLVWDFFLTHFTLTIDRAANPFGFTYRGVPGGAFGAADRLVLSNGTAQSATEPYSGDLPGPAEWAYLTHPAAKQSLFLIQHSDDTLPETYQIADLDTGMFVFGGAKISHTPVRFSLGLVNSCDDQTVRARIDFVQRATP
jgi:hypothetical protein